MRPANELLCDLIVAHDNLSAARLGLDPALVREANTRIGLLIDEARPFLTWQTRYTTLEIREAKKIGVSVEELRCAPSGGPEFEG